MHTGRHHRQRDRVAARSRAGRPRRAPVYLSTPDSPAQIPSPRADSRTCRPRTGRPGRGPA